MKMRCLGRRLASLGYGRNIQLKQVNHPERQGIFSDQNTRNMLLMRILVEDIRLDPDYLLVDSRGAERYWGINETIDPVPDISRGQ